MSLSEKKGRAVAVADVGSGSAACAVAVARPDGTIHILAASRSILPLEGRQQDQTKSGVLRMLGEASANTLKAYHQNPDARHFGPPKEIYGIIRAPWTRANAHRTSHEFQNETVITKEMISTAASEAFSAKTDLDQSNILESSVIRVELNGYPTSTPVGKRARSLDVTTFVSDCDAVICAGVKSTLETSCPGRQAHLYSGVRAHLSTVQDKVEHPEAYVILDMVSEATTVMSVHEGVITDHSIVNEGVRTILRRIAGAKGTSEEVVNLMRMVIAGSCSGEECDRLNEVLARVEPDIVHVFGEAFVSLVSKQRLPNTLIIFTHPDIAPWLANLFARIDFAQFTIPLQPFVVRTITTDALQTLLRVKSDVPIDTGILVAAAFVNM